MQGIPQKEKDDPVVLAVGTQVSAKYKGAFCEAKVRTIVKNIKVRVLYKKGGTGNVSDDEIIGEIRVGSIVEVRDLDKKETVEATITKIQDCSQYTVVFDDGDITTLRRSALCRQSGKHFNACDTLDQLPLTHPEHRGGGKRSKTQDDWSDEDEEYAIGKVICVENTDTKKKNAKESYFPALVVAPKAQETAKIHIKTEYLVRSFKDGRYYTVPKKEVTEFTNDTAQKSDSSAVSAAREYLDKNVLPTHWDREVLIDSASLSEQELSDSSDDEPNEVKDRFFAQLLEFMEKRNSPLNKGPSITNKDVDLYRLYYSVDKLGGYANVTKIRNWKAIAKRLGFTPTDAIVKLVKHSYRKFLLAFEEAVTKGIEELPARTNRDKARSSSTRSVSVASPKVPESTKSAKKSIDKPSTSSIADDSENTNESTKLSSTRKLSTASNKVKAIVEKFEEKTKEKDKEKEKEVEKEKPVVKDEEPSTSSSPAPSIIRKEKAKKKPPEVKKKKEDVVDKKEVAVAASKIAHSGPIIPDDVLIEVDDRLKVYYRGSSDYEAKVLEISFQDGKSIYRVHYKGWNARYDEWIHRESIAENLTKDDPKKKSGSTVSKSSTPSTSAGGSSSNLTTPNSKNASKRGRNRADTTASSRSTTPLSNTSGKGKPPQKRITRGAPASKSSRRTSLNDDNSSESDEPIKKPSGKDDKKDDVKGIQKSASSDLNEIRSELKSIKAGEKAQDASGDVGSKSDDEKSTKSSIKSGKSPFDVKTKLKTIQRDSSRSSFHSSDSDSSHSVPSDVPNSSKSAYTSDNESNGPEKLPPVVATKIEAKKSSFRFDDDSSDVKHSGITSFFDKVGDKSETKPDAAVFPSKKPNIFQEKKLTQQRALASGETKVGRFGQLEKSLTKDAAKGKTKDSKADEKSAESDVYEFKDTEEFADTKTPPSTSKKQEAPTEGLTKKQQLAQQRKKARLLQKEAQESAAVGSASNSMEDIESMIKTSIVQSNKKRKKSPSKEEKVQQSMIVARTPTNQPQNIPPQGSGSYSGWTPVTDHYSPKPGAQSMTPKTARNESTFDVLRKSPSFNMHVTDDLPIAKPQAFASGSVRHAVKSLFGSAPEMSTHELLKPIMVPTNDDEKPELEAFKEILEPSFEILPKAEKSGSIVDKLLKSMNKKDEAEASHHQLELIAKKEEICVKPEATKIEPYAFKAKSPVSTGAGKKPLLVSPEMKIDEKAKANAELQGIIQKLESRRSATPIGVRDLGSGEGVSHFAAVKKQADDSDTDSDPRLVIEDDAMESIDKKMGVLESMITQEDIPYKHNTPSSTVKEESEKKSESGEQQSETMSLLLCEETIPGSPAPVPVKDPLSEIGRSPSSSGGFVHPPTMPSQSSNYMKYPGSITTALLHQQYQSSASHQTNLKQIPMDIDTDVNEAATGDILRDKLKSERGSATSSGNNTNNNSDNSPRDSNDDQSENEKNVKLDVSPKKKKRTMKPEPDLHHKRRRPQPRNANVRGNLQGNDSDSNDNSDVNAFTSSRSQSETGMVGVPTTTTTGKMDFNFLVELDPNLSSNQRINILVKKIQELKKTYQMVKNEMNAKDRRRKKLRRRERENKQKQAAAAKVA